MDYNKISIAIVGSSFFQQFVNELRTNYANSIINIIGIPLLYDIKGNTDYQKIAKILENINPDIFIAGPANSQILSKLTKFPYHILKPSVVDFLALYPAIKNISKTCVVMHHKDDVDLSLLEGITKQKIKKVYYQDSNGIKELLLELRRENYDTIIGNNKAISVASDMHFSYIYYYSKRGMQEAIDNAISTITNIRRDQNLLKELQYILSKSFNGVIGTNQSGIINYINDSAKKMLNSDNDFLLGENISELIPKNFINHVLKDKEQFNDISFSYNKNKIIANYVPITFDGIVYGSCLIMENIDKMIEMEKNYRRESKLNSRIDDYQFEKLVCNSATTKEVVLNSKMFAKSNSPIMLIGENGCGKETLAKCIHNNSPRSLFPFYSINCNSISEFVLEAELFGIEQAPLSNNKRKKGLFELAHGGTVFLGDIHTLPSLFQQKLMHVIREKEITRLNGIERIPTDVRIIASASNEIVELVKNGSFRSDLFYCLNALSLSIPPIRNRKEDVFDLFVNYVALNCPELLNIINDSRNEIDQIFYEYDFPGNIYELQNISERFSVFFFNCKSRTAENCINILKSCIYNKYQSVDNSGINLPLSNNFSNDIKEAERLIFNYYSKKYNDEKNIYQKLGISRATYYNKINKNKKSSD